MHNDIRGFYIEPTNLCTLKCPGCARTQFINQWPQHWKNYNLNIDDLFNFLDISLAGKTFVLGGNYGDPIYHPELIELVKRIKTQQAQITINTNGSYKKESWWQELTSLLDHNDSIVFAIDGVPDNFTEYRINSDWTSIKQAIDISVQSNCQTTWQYIPFLYNQNTIEQARFLSQQLGIDHFQITHSDRFDDQTMHYMPNNNFLADRFTPQQSWKQGNISDINPKCSAGREHFITAEGFYTPCCYLADHRFYYKNIFGKNKKTYNIKNTTITELMSSLQVIDFYNNLSANPGCQFNCPAT